MRSIPRRGLVPLFLLAALALPFGRLIREPDGLLVDGERPTVDRLRPPDADSIGNDLTRVVLPHHARIAAEVARFGRPSFWDPGGFGGRPRVGNPQAGLWYPPAWILWRWWTPAGPGWWTVAHLLWGGLGVYGLARRCGQCRLGALVAASAFEASPYLLAQAAEGHYPHLWAVAWAPWAFWAMMNIRAGGRAGIIALPPILALCLLTGHAQEGYYLVLALSAWALASGISRDWRTTVRAGALWMGLLAITAGLVAVELIPDGLAQGGNPAGARMTAKEAGRYHLGAENLLQLFSPGALGGPHDYEGRGNYWEAVLSFGWTPLVLAGLALASAVMATSGVRPWLGRGRRPTNLGRQPERLHSVSCRGNVRDRSHAPVLGLLRRSPRPSSPGRAAPPTAGPADQDVAPSGLVTSGEPGMSWGLRPRLCSAAPPGLEGQGPRQTILPWFLLAVLSVAFAAGRPLGLFPLLYQWLPGMGHFRVPARALYLTALAMAVLAGHGIPSIAREGVPAGRRRIYARLVIGLAGVVGLAIICASLRSTQSLPMAIAALARIGRDPVFLVAVAGSTIVIAGLGRISALSTRRLTAMALGLLVVLELGGHGLRVLKTARPERFLGPDPVSEAIARVHPEGAFRIRARDAFYGDLPAALHGWEKTNVNDPFRIGHADELAEPLFTMFGTYGPHGFSRAIDPARRQAVLDRLNVALLVTDIREPDDPWPVAATGSRGSTAFTIYANPTAIPRAYVVPRAVSVPDDASTISRFAEVPPREAVLMASDPLRVDGPRQPYTPASYGSDNPDRVDIRVKTQAPGLLVIADSWVPGWSATVDGRPAPTLRGNRAQRVIPLPQAGDHDIQMTFRPPGLTLGAAVSLATLGIWSIAALTGLRIRRRSEYPAPHVRQVERRPVIVAGAPGS